MALPALHLPAAHRLLWRKRCRKATISDLDPEHKVIYLGNVLTGWAKGTSRTRTQAVSNTENSIQTEIYGPRVYRLAL
jgi:hypothetical protein